MTIILHKHDLPDNFKPADSVAVDTETMGLSPVRDRLCLVQLSNGDGTAHLVQFDGQDYSAPNLRRLLEDKKVTKLFHFARFDVAVLKAYLDVDVTPVYCTKLASRLCRTYTDKHGLKILARELAGVDLDKEKQSSDWGAEIISEEQQLYAANDVLYLHKIHDVLEEMLKREGRTELHRKLCAFLPVRAGLDLMGWEEVDIFAHS